MSPPSSPPTDAAWRRTNLGHLLFVATGLCLRDKLAVVHASGFAGVTDAQLAPFLHLEAEGTRLTALAARAGLAKQSMIELVDKAERLRLVERGPDPADGRAKIVRPTPLGSRLREAMEQGRAAAEARFDAVIGGAALVAIGRELASYADARSGGVEDILDRAARRFVRDVLDAAHRRGQRTVTEALLGLFRHIDLDGSRLTELAVAARVTKQSMRALVEQAEALQLVERAPDPVDGRAKTIRFSPSGLLMLDDMRQAVVEAEALFAQAAGEDRLARLKAALARYIAVAGDG